MINLGLDPSLTGFGYSLIDTTGSTLMACGVWETHPDKLGKTAATDNIERLHYIAQNLYDFASRAHPDRIYVEGTVLPLGKSAWNASLLGRCRGLVDMLGAALGVGVTELSPQTVKKGLGIIVSRKKGSEEPAMASKQEVRDRVVKLYDNAAELIPAGRIGENASDAIAVAHVGHIQSAFNERLSSAVIR